MWQLFGPRILKQGNRMQIKKVILSKYFRWDNFQSLAILVIYCVRTFFWFQFKNIYFMLLHISIYGIFRNNRHVVHFLLPCWRKWRLLDSNLFNIADNHYMVSLKTNKDKNFAYIICIRTRLNKWVGW